MAQMMKVTRYAVSARRAVAAPRLTVAVLSDLHAAAPYMDSARIADLVAQTNGLGVDLIVLLGDYAGHVLGGRDLTPDAVAQGLTQLAAPLGVFAVFGNHDWRDDPATRRPGPARTRWHDAFDAAGIATLSNQAVTLTSGGTPFTLAGLESQRAFRTLFPYRITGADDLPAVSAQVNPELFTLLLAHEPCIFPDLPDAYDLTLSGHTHGGQIAPFGRAMFAPARHGARYAYGHHLHGEKQLVVSGGAASSGLPIRIGRPPEITVVSVA